MKIAAVVCLFACIPAAAAPSEITIRQAVSGAVEKYPLVRASLEQVSAAASAVNLSRTAYLPRLDGMAQLNRATHNNVFGMVFPQQVIAPISGPVLGTNSLSTVWGSMVGVSISWEPFDFGLRKANVEIAQSAEASAGAQVGVTRLQVAVAAADAFLSILAARRTVTAAQSAVERAKVVQQVVEALVKAQLRPEAELSRTRAEVAVARNHLIHAEEAVAVGQIALEALTGVVGSSKVMSAGPLLQLPPDSELPALPLESHPVARVQDAAVREVAARQKSLERTYYPRFYVHGATYARGTGIKPDGTTGGALSGMGPNIQNWGLGMTATFNPFELYSVRARKEVERHRHSSAESRYRQTLQDLTRDVGQAQARLSAARAVAANTPVQLEAARAAERQATARYKAGLGAIVELADAQRLLTQAEIDDSLAKLAVWRAMLALAAAQGDIEPFLARCEK